MTPDLLDDLRDADPVDREALVVPERLRPVDGVRTHAARRSRRRVLSLAGTAALAAAAVAAVVALALLPGRAAPPDLAARAYAAVAGQGIVHWRVDIVGHTPAGHVCCRQRREGWKRGATLHVLQSELVHGKAHLSIDQRTVGHRSRIWMSASDDYVSVTRDRPRSLDAEGAVFGIGDPLVAFRAAYQAGRLRDLGGGRFDVAFRHMARGSVVYEVDPRTGRPLRLIVRSQNGSETTMSFSAYGTLADTPANRARLLMLPHPGAGPGPERAQDVFRALREGPVPAPADLKQLREFAAHMGSGRYHLDVDGARALARDVWLIPGRGYVCLVQKTTGPHGLGAGIGGGCTTVRQALREGYSEGGPNGMIVAVPDGHTAIEARYRWHGPWQRVPAPNGLARLPKLGYQVRLAR
ncbi:MAG TPA: hypothetical protein VI318_19540 [Baekduia sp.]